MLIRVTTAASLPCREYRAGRRADSVPPTPRTRATASRWVTQRGS